MPLALTPATTAAGCNRRQATGALAGLASLALGLGACSTPPAAGPGPLVHPGLAAADAAIEAAIQARTTPGAMFVAGNAQQVLHRRAHGQLGYADTAATPWPAVTPQTVYDLASLSKSIATGTAVLQLLDEGRLALSDPAARHLPEFTGHGKEHITVEQLLVHQAGLIADNPMADYSGTPEAAWQAIARSRPLWAPGSRFEYSDVGFIVLGRLVERLSGQNLAQRVRERVLQPLRMNDSAFLPPADWAARCAPTEPVQGRWLQGVVHDPRARALGGTAGHAGLFGTADDVARWCRMLLNGGELDGVRVLSRATVAELARPRTLPDGSAARGLSVDIDTRFSSAPRGNGFATGSTYGHTGYTGTAYWIDPVNGVFYVLLTNRVHPNDKASVTALRRTVASTVASALLTPPR